MRVTDKTIGALPLERTFGDDLVNSGGSTRGMIPSIVALLSITVLCDLVVLAAMTSVRIYLVPDAGLYLADADSLTGNGVVGLRHPPLFPVLLAITRFVVRDDLAAIRLAFVAVVSIVTICAYVFMRGRTGSKAGDLAATAVFAMAPTTAEAVGWYGASGLLG